MLKKILLTICTVALGTLMLQSSASALTLDETFKPDNLPSFETVNTVTDADHPETAATQTIILYVGNLLSKVLLFVGSLTIVFLIVAGANYIFAFGKDQRIEAGKRGLTWSIVGLVLVLLSYAIVQGIIYILLQVDYGASGV